MKAIILISSIFYILGLKIGNKIDLVKKNNPAEKVISEKTKAEKSSDCYDATKEFIKKEELIVKIYNAIILQCWHNRRYSTVYI